MNPYFKTLEIEQGADKQTIKKAYFKMIRKYPPDKNPEEFKKIREAYEYLQKEENRLQLEKIVDVPAEFQKQYYQVLEYQRNHQREKAIALCEEVLKIIELQPFQILLAGCYQENGNYGKAISLWEKLNQKQKDNPEFLMGLMMAYQGRNWIQKALAAGEQLEKLEYCNLRFYGAYAKLWSTREDYRPLLRIAARAIPLYEASEKHTKQEALDLSYIIENMLQQELERFLPNFLKDAQRAEEIISKGIREAISSEIFAELALHLYIAFAGRVESHPECSILIPQYQPIVQSAIHYYDENELMAYRYAEGRAEYTSIVRDEEIDASFKKDIGAWYINHFLSDTGDKEDLFPGIDAMEEEVQYDQLLYWVSYLDELLPSLRKVAKFYPYLARAMSPYLEEMLREDSAILWKKYEKHYKKLMGYPASADLVLERTKSGERARNITYRRETKKVGRNDLCPCGSGKKYKHCCGKNQ